MSGSDPTTEVIRAASEAGLDPAHGGRLVIGVSGGADSMALWDILSGIGAWELVIYHLNHGLRPDADEDLILIRDRQEAYGHQGRPAVQVVGERCDLVGLAEQWHCGLEAAGRRQRYSRLAEVAREQGGRAVITAHHRDDQVETVLLNLLRGAGPMGRAGIARRRVLDRGIPLVRPLLGLSRSDLRSHLASQGLTWREDATNAEQRFRRNHLRLTILPAFETGCPGFSAALLVLAEEERLKVIAMGAQVSEIRARHCDLPDRWLDVAGFLAQESGIRAMVWRCLLTDLGLRVDRRRIRCLDDLLLGPAGRRLTLGRILFLRRSRRLTWEDTRRPGPAAAVPLPGPGIYHRREQALTIAWSPAPNDPRLGPEQSWIDPHVVKGPLVWRDPHPGERFHPLGCDGTQPVSTFLASRSVPSRVRAATGVVSDDQGVLWIPGLGVSERTRLTGIPDRVLLLERTGPCSGTHQPMVPPGA